MPLVPSEPRILDTRGQFWSTQLGPMSKRSTSLALVRRVGAGPVVGIAGLAELALQPGVVPAGADVARESLEVGDIASNVSFCCFAHCCQESSMATYGPAVPASNTGTSIIFRMPITLSPPPPRHNGPKTQRFSIVVYRLTGVGDLHRDGPGTVGIDESG